MCIQSSPSKRAVGGGGERDATWLQRPTRVCSLLLLQDMRPYILQGHSRPLNQVK